MTLTVDLPLLPKLLLSDPPMASYQHINSFMAEFQVWKRHLLSHTSIEKHILAVYLLNQSPTLIQDAPFWCRAHCILSSIVPVPAEV